MVAAVDVALLGAATMTLMVAMSAAEASASIVCVVPTDGCTLDIDGVDGGCTCRNM